MADPLLDPTVGEHYRHEADEDSRIRRGLGELDLVRVREIVRRHLPPGAQRVLDVGGATGVHAEWLLTDGHPVHLIDPVDSQVERACRQLGDSEGFRAQVGDARSLPVDDSSYDVALLFGPLYHLGEREDRLLVWREAKRAVQDGGVIFAMGITRFGSLFDGLAREHLFDPAFRTIVERDLATGRHQNPDRRPGWFTDAYFHAPGELAAEADEAGLAVLGVVGVEGMAAWLPALAARWDDPGERDVIIEAARSIESEPGLIGLSPHHVVVASPS
jgi:ubiquinone/menaquinone biosynthesis C-methylase UbiE